MINSERIIYGSSNISDGNLSFNWGDNDEVIANRERWLAKYGLKLADCVCMAVQHSDKIRMVTEKDKGLGMRDEKEAIGVDGLVTNRPGVGLFLLTADCLPIIFYDPENMAIGLGHLGRLSTDAKLVKKIILKMDKEFGSEAKDLQVMIGPGIHKESYVFDKVDHLDEKEWQNYLIKLPDGKIGIDLYGFNYNQLIESGVKKENIDVSPVDTAQDKKFYSHYRAVRNGEAEGRFATIVGLVK